jgi:hypothetical protein
MTNWKYADATNRVVFRVTDSGGMESCVVTALEIVAWLAAGNTPTPADPPSTAELNAPIMAQIAALEAGQQRAVRESVLGGANTKLKAIDDQIAALRGNLVK